ncbi:short chain dehydrogenase family protein [Mycobacterium ulcerans str. Harvey]|uniref:Short chain dehydrogenase family protein n=1 Tax=Mycobacterium ulcerans str. Harvey TaxID=1299332 RepID=A0ABP3AUJ7_MYCUL|nr:short chain dehydrogenase family protein [Mycobacterium ulcerans str. Harvey]
MAVTARRTDRLASLAATIAEMGGSCSIHPADATNPVAAQSVVADVLERHGKIDVVLLNAGGAPALDLTRLDAADITSVMDANYDVAVNYLVPVLRHMAERGTGVIAHTNSLARWYAVPLQGLTRRRRPHWGCCSTPIGLSMPAAVCDLCRSIRDSLPRRPPRATECPHPAKSLNRKLQSTFYAHYLLAESPIRSRVP